MTTTLYDSSSASTSGQFALTKITPLWDADTPYRHAREETVMPAKSLSSRRRGRASRGLEGHLSLQL